MSLRVAATRRTYLGFVALLAVPLLLVAFAGSSSVSARSSDTWQNGAERFVDDGTNPNGTYKGPTCVGSDDNTGALWVTDTAGVEGVRVTGGQTSVNVRVYSTVRGCGVSKSGESKSALAFVEACSTPGSRGINFSPKPTLSNAYYSPIGSAGYPGTGSYRADTQYYINNRDRQANYNWSDNFQADNYIDATINITGLNSGNHVVCIRGTYSSDACGADSYCKSADREVGFTIDRTWAIDEANTRAEVQSISGTASKTDATVGSTVTWLHTVTNAGPNQTNADLTYLYNNATASVGGIRWSDVIVGAPPIGVGGSIKNYKQSRCMDINGATSANPTTEVRQWNCNGTANQLWTYDSVAQTLKSNTSSTKCLNATGNGVGSVVNLVACNGSNNQKWNFSGPGVQITSVASGLCLDSGGFNGALPDDNANIEKVWSCLAPGDPNSPNQSWFTGTQGHPHIVGAGLGAGASQTFTSTYKIQPSDVGKTLCRRTSVTPRSSVDGSWFDSTAACIGVPYNYELEPILTTTDNSVAEAGSSVHISGKINNAGPTISSPDTRWQTFQITVTAGNNVPQLANTTRRSPSTVAPCAFYAGPGVTCTPPLDSGTGSIGTPSGGISERDIIVGDLNIGDKLCFGNSVQPFSSTSSDWLHSALLCFIVSKKPNINVIGGDVIVGKEGVLPTDTSNIVTSTTSKTMPDGEKRIFGSWGEYGLIASGSISGMASGAGYSGGLASAAAPDSIFCSVSYLTVTNSGTGATGCQPTTPKGGYKIATAFPAIGDAFPATGTVGSAPLNLATTPSVSGSYSGPSVITIDTSTIPAGKWIVINAPTSTVKIIGDIKYTQGPFTSLQQLPQVIIVANVIEIAPTVTTVDAWLMATGTTGKISTCTEVGVASELNANKCTKPLVVNGPVAARQLLLYRTAGAGTEFDTGSPAETFNLRPDAYLWAITNRSDSSRLQTASTVELPPRY